MCSEYTGVLMSRNLVKASNLTATAESPAGWSKFLFGKSRFNVNVVVFYEEIIGTTERIWLGPGIVTVPTHAQVR